MKQMAFGLAAMLVSASAFAQQANRPDGADYPARNIPADSPCISELRQAVAQLPPTLSRAERVDLRQLRDALIIFAQHGNEQGCRTVALEIQRIAQGASTATALQSDKMRREQLTGARAMTSGGPIHLGKFIDNELMAQNGEEVGEISDIVLVPGQQMRVYLMVDRDGGWLDATKDLVAVPLHALRSTEGDEPVIAMSEEAFNKLPTMDDDSTSEASLYDGVDQQWSRQSH